MMTETKKSFIQVENLTLGYENKVVVRDLNFTINRGDVFVLMGMSGCGKSTVMRSIIGLLPPVSGRILIDGVDLWAQAPKKREEIIGTFGISYQSGALFSSMTLYENVALPLELKTDLDAAQIKRRVLEKLKIVGLEKSADFYPSEISGGMVKRAALARALVTNPRALFFDEPSAGLDPLRARNLDELIQNVSQKTGTTVVMVTHDLDSIMTIANNSAYIDVQTQTITGTGNPQWLYKTTKDSQIREFLTRKNTHTGGKK